MRRDQRCRLPFLGPGTPLIVVEVSDVETFRFFFSMGHFLRDNPVKVMRVKPDHRGRECIRFWRDIRTHEALSCIRLTEMGIVCRSSLLCTARVDPEVERAERQALQERQPVCEYFRGTSILLAGFTVNL
jgi:hypothetical protein